MWIDYLKIVAVSAVVSLTTHSVFLGMRSPAQARVARQTGAASAHDRVDGSAPSASGAQRADVLGNQGKDGAPERARAAPVLRQNASAADDAVARAPAVAELEHEIARIESRIAELSDTIADPEVEQMKSDNRDRRQWLLEGQQQARELYEQSRRAIGPVEFARIERAYEEALVLEREGKDAELASRMSAVAESAPDSALAPSALVVKAYAQRRTGNLDDALKTAEQVIAGPKGARSLDGQLQAARGWVLKAEICRDRGDMACLQQARDSLEQGYADAVLPSGSLALEYVDRLF
jgi:hypothetical protein